MLVNFEEDILLDVQKFVIYEHLFTTKKHQNADTIDREQLHHHYYHYFRCLEHRILA